MINPNLFAEIVRNELGIDIPQYRDVTISSPFRSDSNPSFRIYAPKEDDPYDFGSAYDFGTAIAYTPVSFIMELKGMSYSEAVEYIASTYGITLSKYVNKKDQRTVEAIRLFMAFGIKVSPTIIENAIVSPEHFNKLIPAYIPEPISL